MAKRAKPAKAPKAPRGSKGKPSGNTWWDEAEEVPRAGLPDAEKMAKKAKRMRRFVWATLILAPFSLFVTFMAVAGVLGESAEAPPAVVVDKYADTKPAAIVAVREWLAADPAPLPGGTLVGWHSATTDKQKAVPAADEPSYTVESHRLTVADSAGNLYDAYVALGRVGDSEPALINTPSLMPRVPGAADYDGPTWFGLETQSATEEMSAAIDAWATAYSSGDPAALRLTVGDDDASRNYMPLSGAVLSEPVILDSAAVWGDTPVDEQGETSDTVVVRVQFKIDWPTQVEGATPPSSTTTQELATITYDLLVKKANTAAPVVVAWGGPGTGPDLKPYGNAVTGTDLSAAPTDTNAVDLGDDESSTESSVTPDADPSAEVDPDTDVETTDPTTDTETGTSGTGKTKKDKNQ